MPGPGLRLTLAVLFTSFALRWWWAAWRTGMRPAFFWAAREPLWVALPVRILVLSSAAMLCAIVLAPERVSAGWVELPLWASVSGALLGLADLYLFHTVFCALGAQFSTSLVLPDQPLLVSSGPYRLVRHPMYVAYIVLWLAFGLIACNWLASGAGLLAFFYVAWVRTPIEERMLEEHLGEAYRAYCAVTPRFLPCSAIVRCIFWKC